MTAALRFDPIRLPPECEQLRKEVRAFLAEEIGAGTFDPYKPNREDIDVPEFSRKVGARGWLGMTWPKKCASPTRRRGAFSSPTGRAARCCSNTRPSTSRWTSCRASAAAKSAL